MKQYRVIVHYKGKLWCCIDINVPWHSTVLESICHTFSQENGYHLNILETDKIHQIIEYSGDEMRVLSRVPIFHDC